MKTQISLTFFLLFITCSIRLYATEKREVNFKNGNINLKGTLYIPKGQGPFPTVVFVHGSGPETRSNSSYSAKWLASIGYVALAYDKRGSGESDGEENEWNRFSFDDLAGDVVSAVNFLSKQPEVDTSKIGIHATSQGGWVAPLASSKTELISFMIIKSASVCSVGEDRVFERTTRLRKEGFSEKEILEAKEMQLVEAKISAEDDASDEFTMLFEQNKGENWFPRVYGGTDPFAQSLVDYRKWYATIVDFNSVSYLEKSDLPIFWIFGDANMDTYGPVARSVSTVETLKANGKAYTINSYLGEGHNINERKYELSLYNWLTEVLGYNRFKFKKH